MYDELGMLFRDEQFADLFPRVGQPAETPVRLALVTLLQFMEGLTDRQAAEAVRLRIDWKYLLCLELRDRGFHHTVLSEFRTRLLQHGAEGRLFEAILLLARTRGLLQARGRQRTDSTHILGVMRTLTRMEATAETLRHALNALAKAAPTWLQQHTTAEWVDRYATRVSEYRLPKSQTQREIWIRRTGEDGWNLLHALYAVTAPAELRQMPAVETLRQVWLQNYQMAEGQVTWRANNNVPPAGRYISSPHDPDARYASKGSTVWTGYKVHLTETCVEERPNLITNVETTPAAVADDAVTETIHAALATRDLLPTQHIADTGFVNSVLLVSSAQDYGIELVGPARTDNQWQAKAGNGFAASQFTIDWLAQHAVCPQGKVSQSWTPARDRFKNEVIKIKWSASDCRVCPSQALCTRATHPRRTVTVRPQAQHEALLARRAHEQTAEFAETYRQRAGVEGTLAQGLRSCALRRSRYVGLARTHLQHLMIAAAINVVRILRWFADIPKAAVRPSAFALLYPSST
jgi:transposase